MKATIVILTFCVAGVFSGIVNNNKSDVNNECLREYGINPETIYSNPESEESKLTDEQIYCVAACVYRDHGIMRPNGTIDEEKAESFFGKEDQDERNIFFSVYNACKEGNVGCKLAQCMFTELKNHWSSGSSNGSTTDDELEFTSEFTRRLFAGRGLAQFA